MGQCVSCKTGKHTHFYTTSSRSGSRRALTRMDAAVAQNEVGNGCTKRPAYTRGQATLFGFKRRPTSASPAFITPPSSDATPSDDNSDVTQHNTTTNNHHHQPLPSTPRPSRAKKTSVPSAANNRFGFRAPSAPPATNKVGDVNCNTPPFIVSSQSNQQQQQHQQQQRYTNSAPAESRPRPRECSRLVPPTNYRMKNSPNDNQNINNTNRINSTVRSNIPQPNIPQLVPPTKFTLHTSLLPKPQYPVRLNSVEDGITSKGAKTAANNTRKECREEECREEAFSSKEGSPTGDSGLGSAVAGSGDSDTLHGVEQLDSSPTFGHRRVPRRLLGTVVMGKFFDVRDLKDDEESLEDPNVITEISLISIPGTRVNHHRTGIVRERSQQIQQHLHMRDRSSSIATSSDEGHEDEGLGEDDDEGEEKAHRDRSSSEKVRSPPVSAEEEYWGHGEAMAEGYTSSGDESPYSVTSSFDTTNTNQTPDVSDKPPRPVLLTIEDCRFAAIAATAPKMLIEDEKSPVDSVFSSSPPTSSASDLVHTPAQQTAPVLSPETPDTPTNASNSLSLSEGRDFLIDDEIADQPGLTFDEGGSKLGGGETISSGGCSSQMASIVDSSMTLMDSSPRPARKQDVSVGGSPARGRRMVRAGSVDTLSPCESLASDDLMLDFDSSQVSLVDVMTGGSQADASSGPIDNLDEETLMSEMDAKCDSSAWEWSSPLGAQHGLPTARPSSILHSRAGSTPDSPRSLDSTSRPIRSPLRLPRQLNGPSDADDSSVRLDRGTYQYMFQDIVSIKTMLLKLNRILQEADTLNPFDSSLKNGLFYSATAEGSEDGAGASPAGEEVVDLRRQVVLLQSQLEDKERTIKQLQLQVMQSPEAGTADTCNAATQTERMRPVSAGPSLLHSLPSEGNAGPLVSSSDKWRQRPATSEASSDLPVSRLPTLSRSAACKRNSVPSSATPLEHSHPPARKLSSSTLLRKMAVS